MKIDFSELTRRLQRLFSEVRTEKSFYDLELCKFQPKDLIEIGGEYYVYPN